MDGLCCTEDIRMNKRGDELENQVPGARKELHGQ